MKYRKRPVVIEATQWFKNGDHPNDNVWRSFEDTGFRPSEPREGQVVRYFRHPDVSGQAVCSKCGHTMHVHGWIDTLEDGHNVCPADWIITGVKGEYYPCKPDIFAMTYEPVISLYHRLNCLYQWLIFWFKDIDSDKQQGFVCQVCGIQYPNKKVKRGETIS